MAVTGFWPVKGKLKDVLDYADNPDKTTAPEYLDEDLYAALRYAENDNKTDKKMYDKLVFTYNFKDGTNTINLEDIEKVFCSDLSSLAPPQSTVIYTGGCIFFALYCFKHY